MTATAVDLLDGLAQRINDAGIGIYRTAGVYQPSDVAVVFGTFSEQPTQQIALSAYNVADNPVLNDSTTGVQVLLRGDLDPRTVWNRSAAIFDLFQGLSMTPFGSLYLVQLWRQSGRLDGRDDNNRWMTSENYYARCAWPTTYRTD